MAKLSKAISFKNAVINVRDMSITEFSKEDTKVYSLLEVLKSWNNIEGISMSIKFEDDLPEDVNKEDSD